MDSVFWAAFGGGAAAGIFTLLAVSFAEWLRWYMDRPLLIVRCVSGYVVGGANSDDSRKLWFRVRNPHSKTVVVSNIGLQFKGRRSESIMFLVVPTIQLPSPIEGGTEMNQYVDMALISAHLKDRGSAPSKLKWVWVSAESGATYRAKLPTDVKNEISALM